MASKLNTRIILRNSSTNEWALVQETAVLLKGEVGLEFVTTSQEVDGVLTEVPTGKVKMKIGDGVSAWSELSYFGGDECHVTEVTVVKGGDHKAAIAEATKDTTINKGDIAIVKEAIIALEEGQSVNTDGNIVNSEGTIICAQKYQYTAYVYGETADGSSDWKAMDGNYSANNVYFDSDFTFTTNIGTVTGVSGSKTVSAKGKSVKQFFDGLFAKETAGGQKTAPYASVTLYDGSTKISSNTSYEVGTEVTPSYTASFEDGAYTYGPEPTGVTVTGWRVTSTNSESTEPWTTSSGAGTAFIVGDNTSYSITAVATHSAGNYALSNIGNEGTYQFTAGSKSATSKIITGYRKQFYGCKDTAIATSSINSEVIRGLSGNCKPTNTFTDNGATGKVSSGTNGFKLSVPAGSKQVIIALYGRSLLHAYDSGALGTDLAPVDGGTYAFTQITDRDVAVAGYDSYSSVNYKVYVLTSETALDARTIDCVIGA